MQVRAFERYIPLTVEMCNDGQGVRVSTGFTVKKKTICYLLTFILKQML